MLNGNQFGFQPKDSSVHQVIAITHKIFTVLDAYPTLVVPNAFLDFTKPFDRVWHEGRLYKLKCNMINGSLLCLIEPFLTDRQQSAVLNGQLTAIALQGSVLVQFFHNLYQSLYIDAKLFAGDESLFSDVVDSDESASKLKNNFIRIYYWEYKWKMSFNPDKSQENIFS